MSSQNAATIQVEHPGALDESVATIMLQFNINDSRKIPDFNKLAEDASALNSDSAQRIPGIPFLPMTPDVSAETFTAALAQAGYRMYDAYSQERHTDGGGKYWIIRFLYGRVDEVEVPDNTVQYLNRCANVLSRLLRDALWAVRAWHNAFFEDERPIDGRYALSINFAGRNPFRNAKGELLLAHPRNERGHRIPRAQKQPIKPKSTLSIDGLTVTLTPTT